MNFILLLSIVLKSYVSKIIFIKIIKTASTSICCVPKLRINQDKRIFCNLFKKNKDERKIKKEKVIHKRKCQQSNIEVTTNEEHTIVRKEENQTRKKSRSSIKDTADIESVRRVTRQSLTNTNTTNNSEKMDIKSGNDKVLKKTNPVQNRAVLLSIKQEEESFPNPYGSKETLNQLNMPEQQLGQDSVDFKTLYLRVYNYFIRSSNQLHWNHVAFNRGCNLSCFPSDFTLFTKKFYYSPKLINKGATAQVFKIQLTCHEKCEYAMKVLDFSDLSYRRCHAKVFFNHDLYFMEYFKSVPSKYIIKGYAAYYYNKKLYLIYEYFENTLLDYTKKNKRINYKNIIRISQNILYGIDFLHKNRIIHSDIKHSNIAIDDELNIKLFDFGHSFINSTLINRNFRHGYTENYYLTCVIYNGRPCFHDDFWAYGTVLFALVERKLPFEDMIRYCRNEKIAITRKLPKLIFNNKLIPNEFKMSIITLLDISFYDFVKFNNLNICESIENFLSNEERILLSRLS
ncbi:Serine/threonine kinase [Spraguea lophii 42_110]|uniref:Serine/threonine kinase n=1 Tax=Spraguea lophii (strain 42_110) TaxID=1358809 RepID=S7WAH6_SPRLO|nr:Serine/threonine kinase [Spraguea lophii 42_110]